MELFDKLMSMIRMDDDEDDYDDEYDDYVDEVEEPKPKRKTAKKSTVSNRKIDETLDEAAEEMSSAKPAKSSRPARKLESVEEEPERPTRVSRSARQAKVVPIRQTSMEVCSIHPSSIDESQEIADTLLSGRAVILNLEGISTAVAQRIVDFAAGACYAIDGNMQPVSEYVFLITPKQVGVSGDFKDVIGGAFDMSAFSKV